MEYRYDKMCEYKIKILTFSRNDCKSTSFNHRKELHHKVNERRRMPHSADAVVESPITSKGGSVLLVAILKQLEDAVNEVLSVDNWGKKAIRRKTTGTGRMRTLKHIPRL